MSRAPTLAERGFTVARERARLIDAVVALVLSCIALAGLARSSTSATLVPGAVICALAASSSVAWRNRAPEAAVLVGGAGLVGYEWLTRSHSFPFAGGLALLLVMYAAGARGTSSRQILELVGLVVYGIAVCTLVGAGMSAHASVVASWIAPLVFAAVAGVLVARQRELGHDLAAAIEQLRSEGDVRLAATSARERNRVARELHDVVAHGVSVMVVQAGAARITVDAEPELAVTALGEVVAAGQSAVEELGQMTDTMATNRDEVVSHEFGLTEVVTLVERWRSSLPAELDVVGQDPGLPPATSVALYRLVQEALTNIVKYAPGAATRVSIVFGTDAVEVSVWNSAPGAPLAPSLAPGSGHGLLGMGERVQSCGGRLSYGPEPDGAFEVRAELPLTAPAAGAVHRPWWKREAIVDRPRQFGAWAVVVVAVVVLCGDALTSNDRRGSMALNVGLAAAMGIALLWRRLSPLLFLVAVNLLAFPISNGLTSINNPTLVSTYVFVVPVWAVGALEDWTPALIGLLVAIGFQTSEGLYWHLGVTSVLSNALVTVALWTVARVIWSQRRLSTKLETTRSLVTSEQRAREQLTLATTRSRMADDLHDAVLDQVTAMTETAKCAMQMIEEYSRPAAGSIEEIEDMGRQALARLREILGLLRAEHDPVPLPSLLGVEQLQDLADRHRGVGGPPKLRINGVPAGLPEGLDLLAYRVVEEILTDADRVGGCLSIDLRFSETTLVIEICVPESLTAWPSQTTEQEILWFGGDARRATLGSGEQLTVEVPLAVELVP